MAQLYYSPVTVQTGQVPSTQTDFPMLVSYTDNRLKTTGNGGHVANANGYDIRPYSDSALTTALTYELEYYNASTGQVVMWVKVASLADASVVYLGYGDTGLTTNGSGTGTWDTNYKVVYHLPDGTTLSVTDSTSNANNGTNNGATATSGQVDGGAATNGTGQYVSVPITDMSSYTSGSIECWAYDTIAYNAATVRGLWTYISGAQELSFQVYLDSNYYVGWSITGHDDRVTLSASGQSTNTWYHYVYTWTEGGNGILYRNGSSIGTHAITVGDARNLSVNIELAVSNSGGRGITNLNGKLDEWRLSNSVRSANWVSTEYNNQSAPTTFAVLGTEVSVGGGGGAAPQIPQVIVFS